ncbi:C-X-C chemokine receptor type 2-like isoform X2 [Acanthochromis polyacanthus]|uniref:C-X-C chemokine receptor type 2-like isoform X2 n=1 Tax=Acanthochromis polyacanthus TaxID=80966 RepID=UPI0022346641|nr:C-X-C chemokine receptor type 2-like isoform X2 [Acanthochromis polyacanthus]
MLRGISFGLIWHQAVVIFEGCSQSSAEAMSFTYFFNDSLYDQNETVTPLYVNPDTLACELKPPNPTAAVYLCVVLTAIFLLAIPGNLLVGWVIGSSRQLLTPSDIYLFHLTVADGLMALSLPFFAVSVVRGWIFGDFMCKLVNLIFDANFYTSVIFLACISIDRYLVIVRASETFRSRKRMCSRLLCAAVWVFGCTLALPALFNDAFILDPDTGRMVCLEKFDIGSAFLWRLLTRGFLHVFGFLVPVTVMIACYSVTIWRLLHTRGFQKHRAMRVIIAVVIAFLLCWTPYHITMVVDLLMRADLIQFDCAFRMSVTNALLITNGLALVHSGINPFLYAFVGEKFKKKMSLLLQRRLRQERMSSGSKFV